MKGLFENNFQLMESVLDLRLSRQNVVMANMANMKTPGYKARRFEFEKELLASVQDGKAQVVRTDEKHLPLPLTGGNVQPAVRKEIKGREIQGKDSVDLDKEMAIMAKNTMLYNALSTVLKKSFTGLQKVITEGGR
ncbi:MAG: flagellar basal body rod protein FlgB [Desulfovibrionales bacterium]